MNSLIILYWFFVGFRPNVYGTLIPRQTNLNYTYVWTYKCYTGKCEKTPVQFLEEPVSLNVCMLTCNFGTLWPLPYGVMKIPKNLTVINTSQILVTLVSTMSQPPLTVSYGSPAVRALVIQAENIFKKRLSQLCPATNLLDSKSLVINIHLKDADTSSLTMSTIENYSLEFLHSNDSVQNVLLRAENFFGARHGLETISQLIVYDDVSESCVAPSWVMITDHPKYPYRGIMLDTARNYISINTIKNTLDAMSVNKLNTFHWHMTDSQSFPFVSKTFPLFSVYGAYSRHEVYREEDIREVVEYGRVRGVRVVPELDGPAHVGEGWQWTNNATVCFNTSPWKGSCSEPPCGQLDPTSEVTYSLLNGLLSDLVPLFSADVFHLGGDEVNFHCWESSMKLMSRMFRMGLTGTEEDFLKLWSMYQERVYKILITNNGPKDVILWTSSLTGDKIEEFLDKKKYIIQIWTESVDKNIENLIKKGFRVIFSNVDALYLDCGLGSFTSASLNWCSYNWWQKVYMNDPERLLQHLGIDFDKVKHLVLGGEAPLWSETAAESSVGNRIWPRGCALAEALWTGTYQTWQSALRRLNYQRKRMELLGFSPDMVQPEWCQQNQGLCLSKRL